MNVSLPRSIDDVLSVQLLEGPRASSLQAPQLLIEVPHGADEADHYENLRRRMGGTLPDHLEEFFFVNTDVGAYSLGLRVAEMLVERQPDLRVLLLRSLVPRTFIDCNRPADFTGGTLTQGGLTPGIPPYIREASDIELLLSLHRAYVAEVQQGFAAVCGQGGFAFVPHTYGPRTLGIDRIDEDIVTKLRWACAPERHDTWPLRAEIDLLTRDGDGVELSPPGLEAELLQAFATRGFEVRANDTYHLHPSALGHHWSTTYPGRVLTLEVRRDLLVERWDPLAAMRVQRTGIERVAAVIVEPLLQRLEGQRAATSLAASLLP